MTNSLKPQDLIGNEVIDPQGDKIGKVGTVYVADGTQQPEWVTVKTGLFGTKESFVPLNGSQIRGEDIQVQVTKDTVKDAPQIDSDGHLSEEQSEELYRYYGVGGADPRHQQQDSALAGQQDHDLSQGQHQAQDPQTDAIPAAAGTTAGVAGTTAGAAGSNAPRHEAPRHEAADSEDARAAAERGNTAAQTADDGTMVRSEERLKVGTQTAESGRARLRKYVVTEEQTVTVPVSHEEVRIERESISAEEAQRLQGTDIGEQEAEVILHEERPVVQTESVPVERVRLSTETVTEEQSVTGQVRKEQFEMNDGQHSDKR